MIGGVGIAAAGGTGRRLIRRRTRASAGRCVPDRRASGRRDSSVRCLRFHRGCASRRGLRLVGTWAGDGTSLVGWLLPAAEPYRLSRVVGEQAARVRRDGATRPADPPDVPGARHPSTRWGSRVPDAPGLGRNLEAARHRARRWSLPVTTEQYDGLCLNRPASRSVCSKSSMAST